MRASIGLDAARRCASRAPEPDREEIARLAAAVGEARGPEQTDERYAELWRAIVAGSANLAYRLALNSLNAALDAHREILDAVRPADAAAVRALGVAIARGDATGAVEAARALLDPVG
jgi:GntR family transcriptional regulator, transcriptional repressor for pyruvate dehydrogenase complex